MRNALATLPDADGKIFEFQDFTGHTVQVIEADEGVNVLLFSDDPATPARVVELDVNGAVQLQVALAGFLYRQRNDS